MERFLAAVTTGDVQALMDVLAPDVVAIADGGGHATAARIPITGAKRVTAFLKNFPRFADDVEIEEVWVNGAPALRIVGAAPIGTTIISLVVEEGRVARLFAMRNPYKLSRVDVEVPLGR